MASHVLANCSDNAPPRSAGHVTRCRDAYPLVLLCQVPGPGGGRHLLREFGTLNSVVVWMLQHEPEIGEVIADCAQEPDD